MKTFGILAFVIFFLYAGLCAYFLFNLTFWQSLAVGVFVGALFREINVSNAYSKVLARHFGIDDVRMMDLVDN